AALSASVKVLAPAFAVPVDSCAVVSVAVASPAAVCAALPGWAPGFDAPAEGAVPGFCWPAARPASTLAGIAAPAFDAPPVAAAAAAASPSVDAGAPVGAAVTAGITTTGTTTAAVWTVGSGPAGVATMALTSVPSVLSLPSLEFASLA